MKKKILKLKKETIACLNVKGALSTFNSACICISENHCDSGIEDMCGNTVFTTKPVTVQNCGESGNCINTSQINDHCIEIGKTDACAFTEKSCKTCVATNIC